jgi:4-amino-4-deoxy-L-arabinose transferase-like glycosyltransferase
LNKKNLPIIIVCAVFFVLLAVTEIVQPLKGMDLLELARALFLVAGAFIMRRYYGIGESPAGQKIMDRIYRLAYNMCFIVAGIIMLRHGFWLYGQSMIWKGLLYFVSGLALIFAFFYMSDLAGTQLQFAKPAYRQDPAKLILLKIAFASVLSILGVCFIKTNHLVYANLAFASALVQLLLVFRFQKTETALADKKPGKEEEAQGNLNKAVSLAMTAASFFMYYMSFISLQAYDMRLCMTYFIIGSTFFGLAPSGILYNASSVNNKTAKVFDIIYSVFIFAAGLIIFSRELSEVPPGIHGDEVIEENLGRQLVNGYIMPVFNDNGQFQLTVLHNWIVGVAGKIFGTDITTGRWLSIIVGASSLIFVYLLVKELFNRRAAVLSSAFLSCFFMQIFYSRFNHPWIWVPGFAVPAFYFFIRGMKKGSPAYFAAAGVFLGIDLYFYSAAKASPFVLLAFIIMQFLRKETRREVTANWRGLVVMALAAVFVFSPVIDYMIHFPGSYFKRMSSLRVVTGIPVKFEDYSYLAANIIKNIQMYFTESAIGYCHNLPGKPFFDPFISFFALAGLGYLAFTWKRKSSAFIASWVFFAALPGFLSKLGPEDPYPARMVLEIPAIMIVTALGLERIMAKVESLWPRLLKPVMPLVALYVFSWFAFNNLRDYFVMFRNDPHTKAYYRYIDKLDADYIMKNPDKKILLSPVLGWNYYFGVFDALSGGKLQSQMTIEDVSLLTLSDIYDEKGRATTLIGEGIYYKLFPIFKEYFPNASIGIQWDPYFWQLDFDSTIKNCYGWKYPDKTIALNRFYSWFYMFDNDVRTVRTTRAEIPASDIKDVFSLGAEFYDKGRKTGESPAVFPMSVEKGGFDKIDISGLLDVPQYGSYEFRVDGAQGKLFINGGRVAGRVELYKGLHRIRLAIGKTDGPAVALSWKKEGEPVFMTVERRYLIRSDKVFGLLATYSNMGKVIYRELEPAIDYRLYYYNKRPAFPYTTDNGYKVEWEGRLLIKDSGVYKFKMHSFYDSVITINGKIVYEQSKGRESFYPIYLPGGKFSVKIRADYTYISNYWDPGSTLRFMYKKAEWKEFGPVTYDMLSPGF